MRFKQHHFHKLNFRALLVAFTLLTANTIFVYPVTALTAEQNQYLNCTDFKFVFARGSGAKLNSDRDFKPFKAAVDEVFGGSKYTYSFYEVGTTEWSGVKYPAPGIGISTFQRFTTSLGALFSGGEYGDYGDSVEDGSDETMSYLLSLVTSCPNTKIVLAGYSQGAQVISRTLQKIKPSWIYAALTFGDPKLYLPEGNMNVLTHSTAACRGEKLSSYRAFVPDCYAYQGILSGYRPYEQDGYKGKLKAYCQFHDVICSARIDLDKLISGHATYAEQGTYLRGIQDVYNMIQPATYVRPAQDVAILFDVTGSMAPLLGQYQSEAIAVAKRTLKKGGRVALYTYGDLATEGPTKQLCNFETCTDATVETYIKNLKVDGGGDIPESLLSSSYTLMRELKWDIGANKSLVVLTDAGFHNPDRDGITLDQVVALSKSIDPVNFYILTEPEVAGEYSELAELTNGGVYTSDLASAFSDIETEILSRDLAEIYVSTDLPASDPATVTNLKLTKTSATSVHLDFDTDGIISFLTLDDFLAGYTEATSLEITDLDLTTPITLCVSAASSSGLRGNPACVSTADATEPTVVIPKAPNTGKSR